MNKYFDIRPPQKSKPKNKKTIKPKYSRSSNNKGTFLLIIIIVLSFVLFFSFSNNKIEYSNDQQQEENNMQNISNLINNSPSPTITTDESTKETAQPNESQDTDTKQSDQSVNIIVLNGARVTGLAQETQQILEKNNIEVSEIGNTQYPYQNTIIYYTKENEAYAKNIQQILTSFDPLIQEDETLADNNKILIVVSDEKNN